MKMKVWLSVGLCACVLAFSSACSKTPEDVAVKVMKAVSDEKYDALADYADSDKARQGFKALAGSEQFKDATFKVEDVDVDDDEATVAMEYRQKDGDTGKMTVRLKKVDGDWKAHAIH